MSTILDERISKAKANIAFQEHKKRVEKRQLNNAKRKKDSRRHYAIGELFTKHFPEALCLEPGKKADNVIEFEPIESLFSKLASDPELREHLKSELIRKVSTRNPQQP